MRNQVIDLIEISRSPDRVTPIDSTRRYGRVGMTEVMLLEIRGVGGATAEEILNGPVVQASGDGLAGFYRPGEPTSQPTEAYEWGRLTSGSRTSALWWILFPFTLINVAGWMFRPSAAELDRGDEPQRSSLWFSRLVIVGGGLAITAAYVMWITALTTEMVAFGCHADTTCAARWYMAPLGFFGDHNEVWLITCGIGLAAFLILGLFLLILRTQDRLEGYETDVSRRLLGVMASRKTSRLRRNTPLDDPAFWYKWAEHRRLFRWHLGLTVVLLGAGTGHAIAAVGWQAPQPSAWWAILAVTAAVIAMLWALTAPERFRETATIERGNETNSGDRVGWLLIHLGLALTGGLAGWALSAWLRGSDATGFAFLSAVRALSLVLYVAAGLLVILLAVRKRQRDAPTSWPETLMPGFAAALAVIITGTGFAAVASLLGRFLLGAEWVSSHGFDVVIVDIFMLSLIITGLIVAVRIGRTEKPTESVVEDYFGETDYVALSDRERSWVASVARARVIAALPGDAARLLAALTVVMLVLNLGQAAAGGFDVAAGPSGAFAAPLFGISGLGFFHTWAATVTVLYLFPGVQLIRRTSKSRESRRQLGKVWDVLSFWPRRFHPLAAPCYAERAVPEFRNRIRMHLADGKGVVVSAHSQGTVIAFAALVQIAAENNPVGIDIYELAGQGAQDAGPVGATPETAGEMTFRTFAAMVQESRQPPGAAAAGPAGVTLQKTGLVTYGCPLSSLYGPYFSWHFGTPGRFQALRATLADLPGIGCGWRSLWRPTDYIGQRVFIAPGGILDPADRDADIRVREAAQPMFPYESHSNYEQTAEVRDEIAGLLTGIALL
jgi:hypothetical protein